MRNKPLFMHIILPIIMVKIILYINYTNQTKSIEEVLKLKKKINNI